ncbi:hypothetical protein BT63DRAFT_477034 [Microthyrium microscopicum]|uniref:Uncharacterized protein n=1 Tax=Microthyrium microscopicum TaxID=703497 RepID=A0A6A6UL58_9PEZI|nr:hypothetical protein BT63DRAFT_477034 [Microthyrium microscopicum]
MGVDMDSKMPRRKLDSLPVELLVMICEQLAIVHKPSLKSIACVNKTLRDATIPSLFATVKFTILDLAQLVDALQRLPSDAIPVVKHFIVDRWLWVPNWPEHIDLTNSGRYIASWSSEQEDPTADVFFPPRHILHPKREPRILENSSAQSDSVWDPLANVIAQMTLLSELTWKSESRLPMCLLTQIHKSHSGCKLRIDSFRFSNRDGKLDAHEYAIATSPCLYGIRFNQWYQAADHPHADGATRALVKGIAPNLKEVSLIEWDNTWGKGWSRRTWRGVPGNVSFNAYTHGAMGSLTTLVLDGTNNIRGWRDATQFPLLRTLAVVGINAETVEHLAKCQLPSLTSLFLAPQSLSVFEGSELVFQMVQQLARTGSRLQELSLGEQPYPKMIWPALEIFGKSLKKFCLYSGFSKHAFVWGVPMLEKIRSLCPQLEELSLQVPRTFGDKQEVAIYQALGSFPRLRRIHVALNCAVETKFIELSDSGWKWSGHSFETLQNKSAAATANPFCFSVLINCCIDEVLAKSIFAAICSGKTLDSFPLEILKIESTNTKQGEKLSNKPWEDRFSDQMQTTVEILARKWLITVNPNQDRPNELISVQFGPRYQQDLHTQPWWFAWLSSSEQAAMKELWPDSENMAFTNVDLLQICHSFPLT